MVDMLGIVMAGGKSTRFGKEKLIQMLSGQRLIDITVNNISRSNVEDYYVAVSMNSPETMEYCKKYKYVVTPGYGYPEDVLYLLNIFKKPLLLLNGDSVFIDSVIIDDFLSRYDGRSMAAVFKDKEYKFIGLNIAVPGDDTDNIIEYKDPKLALNINTENDLMEAIKLVSK